ncbi:MAG: hypothetical protein Q8T09_06530 [Candidatus Melainabacteria bacterium]|nr:hypothetical protein [Candidatus Melainabacteria bacterium]
MINVYEFQEDGLVELVEPAVSISDALRGQIDSLWLKEKERRSGSLFDGKILSVVELSSRLITCRLSEYRYLTAQRLNPSLYPDLNVRPLAVTGYLLCRQGLVLGLRSRLNSQDQGLWEVVPSGGLDLQCLKAGFSQGELPSKVDYIAQVRAELLEEIGLSWDAIDSCQTLFLLENTDEKVVDIAVRLQAPRLDFAELVEMHKRSGSAEYERLMILPAGADVNRELVLLLETAPVTTVLLQRFYLNCS